MSHLPAASAQGIHQRQAPPASAQNVNHMNAHNGTTSAHVLNNGAAGYYYHVPAAANFQYNADIQNPTMFLNPTANITRQNHGPRTVVNVEQGAQGNYGGGVPYGLQGYQPYSVAQQMPQHYQQQFMMHDQSQQYNMYSHQSNGYYMPMQQMQNMPQMPAQPPAPTPQPSTEPAKKRLLKIVDPTTKEEVKLDTKVGSDDASAAPPKEQPPKEEKPEDDPKQRFAKAVATRAIDSPEKTTPEPSKAVAEDVPAAPAASPPAATPEVASKTTPSSVEEEKPPTSASAPPPSITAPPEQMQVSNAQKASSLEPSLLSESNTVVEEPANAAELNTTPSTPVAPSETPTPDHSNHVQEEDFTELEEEATKLFNEEEENIKNLTYSFKVLDIFHTVIKRFQKIQPPPDQMNLLRNLGLDIQSEPPQQPHTRPKYGGTNSFTPSWQPTNNPNIIGPRKQPYGSRNSEKQARRKPLPPRNSMDRTQMRPPVVPIEPLRPAENAWKPKRREDKAAVDDTEKKYEVSRKEIRSILNKVTPSNYEELAQDFYALNVEDDQRLQTIAIDLIFDKAVEEPKFCPLYTNICKGQVDRGGRKDGSFFRAIISKCQSTFEGTSAFADQIKELQEKLEAETDDKKKADLEERVEMLKAKEKRVLVGNIKFISHLFTASLLSDGVVSSCIYILQSFHSETNDDIYIQYAIELLELVADIYFQPEAKKRREGSGRVDNVDPFIRWVPTIKNQVSTKVKVLIMNFEDFVRAGYKRRNAEKGPKTIAEIHDEAKKEDAEKVKERHAYDAQQKEKGRFQQQQPRQYVARGSLDKKDRNHAMAKAANASSNVGNTTAKPQGSIRKLINSETKLGSGASKASFFSKMSAESGSPAPAPLNSLTVGPAVPNDHSHSGESDGGSWDVVGKKGTANANPRKASRERH